MVRKLILPTLLLAIVGCASTEPPTVTRIETVEVYKPVFKIPDELKDFPTPQRPDLSINYLTDDDKSRPGHVAKIIIESMATLQEYAEALEDHIDAYNTALRNAEKASNQQTND